MPSPVFLLTAGRSGSTLLRCVLDAHPEICAPHELHLGQISVRLDSAAAELAVATLGLDATDLEYRLWDSLLYHVLAASGKSIVVEKTPGDVRIWRRISECWPDACYLFLLRDPRSICASAVRVGIGGSPADSVDWALTQMRSLTEAMDHLTGLAIRYEDLTRASDATVAEVCEYLGVRFVEGITSYGRREHGPFLRYLGDFGDKIRSGAIGPAAVAVDRCASCRCQSIRRTWGYDEPAPRGRTR